MSELQLLLEELADAGEPRGARKVFAGAATEAIVHRHVRRRRRVLTACSLVVIVAVAVSALVSARTTSHGPPGVRVGSTTVPAPVTGKAATATQLANGHWEVIPPAPTKAVNPSTAWTGKELLVWGQADLPESSQSPFRTVAMAYDPTSHTWRTLPPPPIEAAPLPVTVWTGTELLIPAAPGELGAAYDPSTNLWRTLPRSDVQPSAFTAGVWTGDRAVFFAGSTAVSYDPKTDTWRRLASAAPGSAISPVLAVTAARGEVLAWYLTETAGGLAQNCLNANRCGGTSALFRYDEPMDRWTRLGSSANTLQQPEQAFRTGSTVLVRGFVQQQNSSPAHFPEAESSASLNTQTGFATALPADPIAPNNVSSAWTGRALWSVDARDNGDASAYDPASNTWLRLPSAPFACTPSPPVFTGSGVLMYCDDPVPALPPSVGGLEFVSGPADSTTLPRVTVSGMFHVVGGPYPGFDRPLTGTIVAVDASGKQYRAHAGTNGRYSLRLPRGTYDVYGQSGTFTHCGPGSTDIVADTKVDVICSLR